MAFSITCPKCSAKLKTAAAIPIGRSVQCPKCKTSFAVSDDNMEEVADGKPMAAAPAKPAAKPAAAAAKPSAALSKLTPARSNRDDDDDDDDDRPRKRGAETNGTPKSRKRDDDDDDDRPRSRKRDDDEDERPRSKKRDDDDDDRPRSKKRDDDDDDNRERKRSRDDDDKPRSRKRDDDDDDRPSKRGRDDDDDDRPGRKKKKKKKKKGSKMMLWVILGSVVVLAGVAILLYFIFAGGGYDKEMLALMPSDATSLSGLEVSAFVEHSKFKNLAEKQFTSGGDFVLLKKAGLSVTDVKRQMEGHTKSGSHVNIVRLKNSADQGKITQGGSESKAGEKKYWKVKQNESSDLFVAFPADDLVLMVSKEDTMKEILNKESGKITVSERLKEMAGKVGGGARWSCRESQSGGEMGSDTGRKTVGSASRMDISSGSISSTLYQMYAGPDEAQKEYETQEKKRQEELKKTDDFKGDMGKSKLTSAQIEAVKKMVRGASLSKSGSYLEVTFELDLGPFENVDEIGLFFLVLGGGF
jgi:hypothetical protein